MEIPLRYNDLENDKKMKSQFNQLRFAIFSTDENSEDADIEAVNELVQREVTAKPILARIVNQGNTSLLVYFCISRRHNEQFHPAIKRIIGANPSALQMANSKWYETDPHDCCPPITLCIDAVDSYQLSVGFRS